MFKRPMSVIGLVLDIIHPAGRVHPTEVYQNGGDNSIAERQPQPVNKELKAKPSRAKRDTQAQSSKTETLCAPTRTKKSSTPGTPLATPAPQPVKSKPKAKRSPAQRTTQAVLPKRGQKAAQAESGATGKPRKTPASKTRQHVK